MRRLLTSGIFVVFCFLTVTILAQVPQLLNYQGRLTDDKGIPIITTTTVRFSLYQGGDAATPGSGTLVYEEDASVTPDDNGVFNHLIGSGTVIFGALDATVFQTAEPVFLEITIDPAGANETLLPRKQIVTVGYSFKSELADDADTVDGQDAAAFAPVGHNHDPDYVNEGQANSVNSAMIVNGTIVDADINAGANIAGSKIDPTGLDADLLDGKDSLDFVHTAGDDMTGTLNVNTATQYALYGATSHTSGYGVSGFASASSGLAYGVYGESVSSDGHGVYGYASATTGINYGIYGISSSTSGYGVYGRASNLSGTNYGVYGINVSTSGLGVFGYANASSGTNYGVYGQSASTEGTGVYGYASATTGTNYGVYGISNSPSGYAGYFEGNAHVTGNLTFDGTFIHDHDASDIVSGKLDNARLNMGSGNGIDADMVDGEHAAAFAPVVHNHDADYVNEGQADSVNSSMIVDGTIVDADINALANIAGSKIDPTGLDADLLDGKDSLDFVHTAGDDMTGTLNINSSYLPAIYAKTSGAPQSCVYGEVWATAYGGIGVHGKTSGSFGYGVLGEAPTYGVRGNATATEDLAYGVFGQSVSTSGYGVYGEGPSYGVYGRATGNSGYGVSGSTDNPNGYAGWFWGRVNVTQDLDVSYDLSVGGNLHVGGTKECVQPIDNGKKVLLYAMESPEIWFEDFGSAQLVNGQAVVQLESVFTQAANTEIAYFVFPIPNGDCNGLYIARQDKDSFEVRELGGGTSSISFYYRIVAKRRGYEEVRFEEFTEPEQSPEEPNLPVEKK